jgi:hypothetical protein
MPRRSAWIAAARVVEDSPGSTIRGPVANMAAGTAIRKAIHEPRGVAGKKGASPSEARDPIAAGRAMRMKTSGSPRARAAPAIAAGAAEVSVIETSQNPSGARAKLRLEFHAVAARIVSVSGHPSGTKHGLGR